VAAQRISFVTVSRALLTLAAAVSLVRVFPDASWVAPIAVAALFPPILYAFAQHRRWNPLAATGLVALVGAWFAIVVDSPSEIVAGVPTLNAFSTFGHDFGHIPYVLRNAHVPIPATGSALLVTVLAVYVAAAATDRIARRLDAPVGAMGPSIALFVALAALGSNGRRWAPSTACYALTIVAYLVALNYSEVSTRRTWFHSQRSRRSQALAGGLAGGALIVAFAIAFGPSFPGATGDALIDIHKSGVGNGPQTLTADSPFLSISSKLNQPTNNEVFTVAGVTQPLRWRVIGLDTFNSKDHPDDWALSDSGKGSSNLEGPSNTPGATFQHQTVNISAAGTEKISRPEDVLWLPAAFRPIRINDPKANVLPHSSTLYVDAKRHGSDVVYSVDSEIVAPDADTLRTVSMDDLKQAPNYGNLIDLPSRFPAPVAALARELTVNQPTPYDKAFALQSYFQSDAFTYDPTVDYSSSPHALSDFVLHTRRGFCEQFAAAFGEMARSIGLPTRIAVGYEAGDPSNGVYHVHEKDAHAWPEVWLGPAYGWQAFERTKTKRDPTSGRGDPTASRALNNGSASTTTTVTTTPSSRNSTPTSVAPSSGPFVNIDPKAGTQVSTGRRVAIGLGIGLAAVLVALAGVVLALALAARRRTRRRRTNDDTRWRVLGAWAEALERLSAAGVTPRPSATSIEFALRHAPAHGAGGAGPPLMDLARLQTSALFAPDPPSADDADAAWRCVDSIEAALRGTVTRGERWLTRLRVRRRDRRRRS
jgi:transglutaminase-like putative cysteine protease